MGNAQFHFYGPHLPSHFLLLDVTLHLQIHITPLLLPYGAVFGHDGSLYPCAPRGLEVRGGGLRQL